MCGLNAFFGPNPPHVEDLPVLDGWPNFTDHYRIPPSSLASVIRQAPDGRPVADLLKWGLISHWAKDETIGRKLINARGENVADKPSFRSAYRKRRCIVPASGFYEWREVAGQKWKQPYYLSLRNGELMGMGGLWES
jgi:putative SOS response-associated peptidase YedK